MKDKDKKGLWKFLLGLLKVVLRIGEKHVEKHLEDDNEKNV